MSNQCIHGLLARQCPLCEAACDHAAAMEMIDRLRGELADAHRAQRDAENELSRYRAQAAMREGELRAEIGRLSRVEGRGSRVEA